MYKESLLARRLKNLLYWTLATVLCTSSALGRGGPKLLHTIYNFRSLPDGEYPSLLLASPSGVLYGVTPNGGDFTTCGQPGCGTVFSLTPPSSPGGAWSEEVLYSFGLQEGYYVVSLILGPNRHLFVKRTS